MAKDLSRFVWKNHRGRKREKKKRQKEVFSVMTDFTSVSQAEGKGWVQALGPSSVASPGGLAGSGIRNGVAGT